MFCPVFFLRLLLKFEISFKLISIRKMNDVISGPFFGVIDMLSSAVMTQQQQVYLSLTLPS